MEKATGQTRMVGYIGGMEHVCRGIWWWRKCVPLTVSDGGALTLSH